MHIIRKSALLGAFAIALAAPAFAGPQCTTEPKDKWMSEAAMKAKIEKEGYRIKTFQVSGSCYETYGFDKDGRKVEIYFNPVDGAVVKKNVG